MAKSKIIATYDYRDEDNRLLYQVVRLEPKDFRQRKPNGTRWEWRLDGVRRVLYLLPLWIKEDKRKPIFIVEGEKDVQELWVRGLIATCNAGGAGKWLGEYNVYLYGRNIAIIPDNDEAGHRHAELIANSMFNKAASVKILQLPNITEKGGDISDWFKIGGTKSRLLQLWKSSPKYTPKIPEQKEPLPKKITPQYTRSNKQDIQKAREFPLWRLLEKKAGQKVNCIWHKDDKPSLHLYAKGNGYCFVCCKSVDSISWLMQTQGLNFISAVESLQ